MVRSMPDQESLEIKSWSVSSENANIRLDAFARRCLPHLSRREVESAIRQKLFWINARVGKKGHKLTVGDVLTFKGTASWLLETPPAHPLLSVTIVYEDALLLVLDKPAGMPTHGFSGRDADTVANFLVAQWPKIATVGKNRWEPGLVHRLDRETSGLLLIAKTQEAFDDLRLQFRRREIKKRYRALVWGITEAEGSISYPITHVAHDKRRMEAVIDGEFRKGQKRWKALTRFRKLGESRQFSLLEIEIETGVTHQIRIHLAAAGHPIVGDPLYGMEGAENLDLGRHFLHASGLKFSHPADRRIVRFESELPEELQNVLAKLALSY